MNAKSGIDLSHVDAAFAPGDDLYRHLNGGWLKSHQIPADRASDGVAYALHDEAEAQVREIIEGAHLMSGAGADAQKIGDLYRSFMNTEAIEKLGVTPLADDLAAIDAISSVPDFISTMSVHRNEGRRWNFRCIYLHRCHGFRYQHYLSKPGRTLLAG